MYAEAIFSQATFTTVSDNAERFLKSLKFCLTNYRVVVFAALVALNIDFEPEDSQTVLILKLSETLVELKTVS